MDAADRGAAVLANAVGFGPAYGYSMLDPALVAAQSAHETGNFSSELLIRTNNAFGMKHPAIRDTTSTGPDAHGYAIYPSIAASVADYFLRQQAFRIPDTDNAADYIAATVASNYAEDPRYAEKWAATYGVFQSDPQSHSDTYASVSPWLLIGAVSLIALSFSK